MLRLFVPVLLAASLAANVVAQAAPKTQPAGKAPVAKAPAQPNVIGNWVGRVEVKPPTKDGKPIEGAVPKPPPMKYTMTLSANGSFTTSVSLPNGQKSTTTGKWTRSGNTVTMNIEMRDGKPNKEEPRRRVMTLSRDGRTLSTSLEGQMTMRNEKGETRPLPPGIKPPVITLIFSRAK